jgi:hypothetical protein
METHALVTITIFTADKNTKLKYMHYDNLIFFSNIYSLTKVSRNLHLVLDLDNRYQESQIILTFFIVILGVKTSSVTRSLWINCE